MELLIKLMLISVIRVLTVFLEQAIKPQIRKVIT
ncbi:hypothetical protein C8C88_1664 [Flavobacterium sp. 123]|jgi:hypothetical protein|nr:hypothetical protein C8C88_1664 [Flavobacterium sp. 123]